MLGRIDDVKVALTPSRYKMLGPQGPDSGQ